MYFWIFLIFKVSFLDVTREREVVTPSAGLVHLVLGRTSLSSFSIPSSAFRWNSHPLQILHRCIGSAAPALDFAGALWCSFVEDKAQSWALLGLQCSPAYLGLAGNLNINLNIDAENCGQVLKIQPLKQSSATPTSVREELSTAVTFIGDWCCEVKKGDLDLEEISSTPKTLSFNLAEEVKKL